MPTFGSLFAGIGGIDLGLERAGWECRFQIEWDPYCQHVLAHHWPDVPRYGDITAVDWSTVEPVDLLAGGFPCQPFSNAGKRRGVEDDRWLWPEFARAIGELRPRYVLVENVPGLLAGHGGMGRVLGDLATLGYDAEWDSLPAAAVGAPHLRYRVWIIAYQQADAPRTNTDRLGSHRTAVDIDRSPELRDEQVGESRSVGEVLAYANGTSSQGRGVSGGVHPEYPVIDGRGSDAERLLADTASGRQPRSWEPLHAFDPAARPYWEAAQSLYGGFADQWSVEPDVGRVAHGVPARVDRLRALGNAVVPQVVEVIGRHLLTYTAGDPPQGGGGA